MIMARQAEWGAQALRPQLLDLGGCEGQMFQPPLALRPGEGLVAEVAHRREAPLVVAGRRGIHGSKAACQHPLPAPPPCPGHRRIVSMSWMGGEVSPRAVPDRADEANGRLPGQHHRLLPAGR